MIMEPACVNHLEDGKTVEITCECFSCNKEVSFNVSEEGYTKRFVERQLIQNCFPELDPKLREMLMSGTCPECWDVMFGRDEKKIKRMLRKLPKQKED